MKPFRWIQVAIKSKQILLLAAITMLFQGCTGTVTQGEKVKVYYVRDVISDTVISAVEAIEYPVTLHGDKVTAAMKKLLTDPGVDGLSSPFPKRISLKSIQYDHDKIIIGLSEEYGEMTGAELAAADACTVMTLCSIEGFSAVRITVNGEPHPSHEKDYLAKEDIITDDLSLKPVEKKAFLYFSDGNPQYIVPELKNIIVRENESIERYIMEELIKGPTPNEIGLRRILGENTRLISISTENRICYVNLSSEFKKIIADSRAAEIQALYSITDSLCEIEGVEGVQLQIEGERIYGNTVMHENTSVIGAFSDSSMDVTIYMRSNDLKLLEAVPARIEAGGGFDLERLIVERLITGIDKNGFMSDIPKGTMLLGISQDKDTCILNFSKEFIENDEGNTQSDLMIQAIVLSLTNNIGGIENIRIEVEGEMYANGELIYPNTKYIRS